MSYLTHSRTGNAFSKAWNNSALFQWCSATPSNSGPVSSSFFVKQLSRHGRPLQIVLLATAAVLIIIVPSARPLLCVFTLCTVLSYIWPLQALALIPAALIWSPKLGLATTADEVFFLRIDHALTLGITLHLLTNGKNKLKDNHIYVPIALFITFATISTTCGIIQGTVTSPLASAAYLAQIMYLWLIFAAARSMTQASNRTLLLYAWIIPVLAAASYGIAESLFPIEPLLGSHYRTFERLLFDGQANHFGGLFAISAILGLALLTQKQFLALGACLTSASLLALAGTGSREGAVAMAAGLCVFIMIKSPRSRLPIITAAIFGALLLPAHTWNSIFEPGGSMYDRLLNWKTALSSLSSHPISGLGTGARHRSQYDNQYIMVLSENGIIGLLLFMSCLLQLGRALLQGTQEKSMDGAIRAGVLAALAAICAQSLAAVCFMVTVVAGPLLWICGYALAVKDEG